MHAGVTRYRAWRVMLIVVAMLGVTFVTTSPASAATTDDSVVLDYDFQWQENYYYCGPAATRIALTGRGVIFSQDQIAGQLGTTTNGTNSANDTTRVLNGMGETGFYETKWVPGEVATQAEKDLLKSDVLFDIDRGYPIIANIVANIVGTAVDTDGDAHSCSGGHYLTIVGYDAGGDRVKVADPADANNVGWYWVDTPKMADWMGLRGYSA